MMRLSLLLGLVYFVSELLLTVTRRSTGRGGVRQDRSTLRMIWAVILVSIAAGIYVAAHWRAATLPHPRLFALVGLLIFLPGLVLRWWAIIRLGRFFTVDVTIAKDHALVESGPYRWVRHPSYTGVLLGFIGFALSLSNWAAFLVIVLPIFAAFIYRMKVEEQALHAALGEPYGAYIRRTKRLVPFLY
jgi:protein-S-isoprenylcysteine O-methyltransferase